jgi:hypothetical protein
MEQDPIVASAEALREVVSEWFQGMAAWLAAWVATQNKTGAAEEGPEVSE